MKSVESSLKVATDRHVARSGRFCHRGSKPSISWRITSGFRQDRLRRNSWVISLQGSTFLSPISYLRCLLYPIRLPTLACRTTSLLLDGGCDRAPLPPTTIPPFCLELPSRVLILPTALADFDDIQLFGPRRYYQRHVNTSHRCFLELLNLASILSRTVVNHFCYAACP